MSAHWSLSCASLWNYCSYLSTKSGSHIKAVLRSCFTIRPLTATELCRGTGHPGGCKIIIIVIVILIGSESTSKGIHGHPSGCKEEGDGCNERKLLHISTASLLSPGTCWMLTLVLRLSPQVKQGGPQTKINLFHDNNKANAFHFKSFQFYSTFFTSEFAFPTNRSSPNFFQAFQGQQVPDSHSKSHMVFI